MPPVVRPVSPVRSCWREPTRSGFSASSCERAKPSKSWSSSSVRSVMTTSVGFLSCGYSATAWAWAWAYSSPSPWTCLGPGRGGEEPQRAGRAWCRPHPRAERQAAHQGAGPASGGSGVRPRARPARPAAHCRAVAQDRGAGRQRADRLCGGRHGDGAHRRSYGAAEHYRRDQADGKRNPVERAVHRGGLHQGHRRHPPVARPGGRRARHRRRRWRGGERVRGCLTR
jgi:hypothetical protein